MSTTELLDKVLALDTPEAQEQYLRLHRDLLDPEAVKLLKAKADHALRDDIKSALKIAETAVAVAAILNDPSAKALSARSLAQALHLTGDLQGALAHYDGAEALYQALGDEVEAARTLLGKIDALTYLSRYQEALALADRCYAVFQGHGQAINCAKVDLNRGNIHHRLDQYEAALECYLRAREGFVTGPDKLLCALADSNLGNIYTVLNQFRQASQAFRRARRVYQDSGLAAAAAMNESNDGYLHYMAGDFTTALALFSAAREQLAALGVDRNLATVDLDAAELYCALNLLDEAVEAYERAEEEFRQLGIRSDAARALTGLAVVAARRGDPARARRLLDEAAQVFDAEGNTIWLAIVELHRAVLEFEAGQFASALERCRRARASLARQGLRGKEANAQLIEGRILEQSGDRKGALRCFRAAVRMGRLLYSQWLLHEGYYGLARVTGPDKPTLKERYLRRAITALEHIRASLTPEELKMSFLGDKLQVYADLVLLLQERGDEESIKQAFEFVERAKSQALVDLLAGKVEARPDAKADSALLEQIARLRGELNSLYSAVERHEMEGGQRGPILAEAVRGEVRLRERELLRLQRRLELRTAEYASLNQPTFVSVDTVQASLPPDATLLEYFGAGDQVGVFVVRPGGIKVIPNLASSAQVSQEMERLAFQLRKFSFGVENLGEFEGHLLAATRQHLGALHRLLIAPLRGELTRRLIVVPAGVLHYMPFQALHDGQRYLLQDHEVTYAPSASVLHFSLGKDSGRRERLFLMAVGDPALPQVVREAETVAALFPQREMALDAAATLERFKEAAPGADIVHIASHGVFRWDNPLFSSIKLGDGWMSVRDIYGLQLGASLVTLSACETGVNQVAPGEELLGMARGFFYAGTPSLVVSLWMVNDDATAELMESFYRRLRAGATKGAALREAQLEVMVRRPHPYYWAPFALVGKGW